MKSAFYLLIICIGLSCSSKKREKKIILGPSAAWLDSVKQQSDTSYTNPYRSEDFATADYYVNRSLHTVC
ncbi:MAG TPA: hypothetical protein VLJ68_03375, partial [Chitinophagaceae bacterium]|nr:hypothetical protein [Chitinophagaceae bacterium]